MNSQLLPIGNFNHRQQNKYPFNRNMKKVKKDKIRPPERQLKEEGIAAQEAADEVTGVNTIQEFLDLKKLQNRVLKKMLEKMNTSENQIKPTNK
ncbi:MAG: hypothetical protein WCI92_07285 [Bacteroidota bacterium]